MEQETLIGLGTIVVLGVGSLWAARLLRLPAILLLLAAGILAGPLTGLVDPDALFGNLLFPGVSLAVGLLLYEGGLGLRFDHLARHVRTPVLRLVTLGVAVTWGLAALAIGWLFDVPPELALLIGAVLVVSGPTVVGPLLKLARPREPAGSILEWEGILIDPIGATLAIVVLNGLFLGEGGFWRGVLSTAVVGVGVGVVAAAGFVLAARRFLIPDDVEVAVALLFVVAAFVSAELALPEAGLFATTALGVALANQRLVPVLGLRVFGRTLGALIIGSLFVVLGARVDLDALRDVLPATLALVAVLVLVVRPLNAALCTFRTATAWRDRAFVGGLAPRGIVAAATASLFAVKLADAGHPNEPVVPIVFGVIIAAGVVYGLGAVPLARLLGVAKPPARGIVLIAGAPWIVDLACAVGGAGVPVLVVAPPGGDVPPGATPGSGHGTARPYRVHDGLLVDLEQRGALDDMAWAVVASRDEEYNLLALPILVEGVGRRGVLLLPTTDPTPGDHDDPSRWARPPFGDGATLDRIDAAVAGGARLVTLDPVAGEGIRDDALPLVRIRADGSVNPRPRTRRVAAGERLVVLQPVPALGMTP